MNEGYFEGSSRIFYRFWTKSNGPACVVAHGLGEHSGCYKRLADGLDASVYALDLVGHGQSGGKPGVAKSFQNFLEDLKLFIEIVVKKQNKPIILLGHSMGGLIVTNYLLKYSQGLSGAILSSPLMGFCSKIPKWKQVISHLTSICSSRITLRTGIKYNNLTKDQNIIREYVSDSLRHGMISSRLFHEMQRAIDNIFANTKNFSTPILILEGLGDKVVSIKAIDRFYDLIKCPKMIKRYENVLHEPFNDIERDLVYKDVNNWLANQGYCE